MVDLKPYNTLQVSARAHRFLEITDLTALPAIDLDQPYLFIGSGANILFTQDFPGTVIRLNTTGYRLISQSDSSVTVSAAAGHNWHHLVMWSAQNGWWGLQNMALIPGTVGAAALGNIAAFGGNQEDVFDRLEAMHLPSGKITVFSKSDCDFTYRESYFKHHPEYLITSVQYQLSKNPHADLSYHSRYESLVGELAKLDLSPDTPQNIAAAVISLRQVKQPDWTKIGTAGSFFKNPTVSRSVYLDLSSRIANLQWYPVEKLSYTDSDPLPDQVKIPAGRLLDELGWKGKQIGRVSTHSHSALVVINLGGASGSEIFSYSEQMRSDIKKNFGLDLEYEVRVI